MPNMSKKGKGKLSIRFPNTFPTTMWPGFPCAAYRLPTWSANSERNSTSVPWSWKTSCIRTNVPNLSKSTSISSLSWNPWISTENSVSFRSIRSRWLSEKFTWFPFRKRITSISKMSRKEYMPDKEKSEVYPPIISAMRWSIPWSIIIYWISKN